MPKSYSKPDLDLVPGQERSLTVHLKSLRNPPLDIKLTSQSLTTSILDLKSQVAEKANIPADKLRLLFKKKPVPDSRVLKELISGDGEAATTVVEFSVMVIGGAAAVKPTGVDETVAATEEAAKPTGTAALDTDAFWDDLKGFLMQRLKDEKDAEELTSSWRAGWQSKQ